MNQFFLPLFQLFCALSFGVHKKEETVLYSIINDTDLKMVSFLPPRGQTIGVPSSHAYNKQGNGFYRSTSCGKPAAIFDVVAVHIIKVDMASSSDTSECHEDIAANTCGTC